MIRKLDIPKFKSEAGEAEWWGRHRDETAKWLEEALAAGQTTTLPAVLQRARKRSRRVGGDPTAPPKRIRNRRRTISKSH